MAGVRTALRRAWSRVRHPRAAPEPHHDPTRPRKTGLVDKAPRATLADDQKPWLK